MVKFRKVDNWNDSVWNLNKVKKEDLHGVVVADLRKMQFYGLLETSLASVCDIFKNPDDYYLYQSYAEPIDIEAAPSEVEI